jgi:hypothetical protein
MPGIEDRLNDVFQRVRAKVDCDLGKRRSREWPILVLYARSSDDLGSLFPRLAQRRVIPLGTNAHGLYAPKGQLVLITGCEDTEDFLEAAAHELTHALCRARLRVFSNALWCHEGYARAMLGEAFPDPHLHRRALVRDVRSVLDFHRRGLALHTRQMLQVTPRTQKQLGPQGGAFGVQASAFFQFLLEQDLPEGAIRRWCLGLLHKRAPAVEEVERQLERFCRKNLDELHAAFLEFCAQLPRRAGMKEPWERPDYWQARDN